MPWDAIYDLGALVFAGSGAFRLDGIDDSDIDPAITEHTRASAGSIHDSYVSVMSQEPMIRATCTEIAKVLTNISPLTGLGVKSGGTVTSFDAFMTQSEDLGSNTAGSTHFKATINKALIIPESLTVSQGGVATITISIHVLDDQSNAAIVYTDLVALPTATALAEQFTLGNCHINGTQVKGVTQLTINFGLGVEKRFPDGKVFPSYATVRRGKPGIHVTTEDPRLLSTLGLSGAAQSATPSTFSLRKKAKQGTRVADATTEHIKFTVPASQGMFLPGGFSGSAQAARSGTIRCVPVTGTNPLFSVSVASAV